MPRFLLFSLVMLIGACQIYRPDPTPAQPPSIEDQLVAAFDTFYANAFSEAYRDQFFEVRDSLKEVLRTGLIDVALDQPLPKLEQKVSIRQAPSGRLRTFSWDERSGGTWHDMALIAQFQGADQQLHTQVLDPQGMGSEMDPPPPPDMVALRVYDMAAEPPTFLLIGYGTYGSGHHHEGARLLRLEQDTLVDIPQAFGDDDYLTVFAARRDSIGLSYQPATRRLQHRVFKMDEEIGFMFATDEVAEWQYQDGRFVRIK